MDERNCFKRGMAKMLPKSYHCAKFHLFNFKNDGDISISVNSY